MAPEHKGLVDRYGRPLKVERPPATVRARYDAAASTDENARHWVNADGLSANASNAPAVRKKLRDRARYECQNNSYAHGLVNRLANDCIGTGPRLQLTIPGAPDDFARRVESQFAAWAADERVDLADKLRVMDASAIRDGECFGLLTTNPGVAHPVKLDLKLVEADQCCDPVWLGFAPLATDGIRFDAHGNPVEYHFLRYHPGDSWVVTAGEVDKYPAAYVLHWFSPERPGQARGVPEITPALPLFNQMRRYTLATLSTAEWAACVSAVLTSNLPPTDGGEVTEARMEVLEIVRNAILATPYGQDIKTLRSEQPTTVYPDFKREILNETGCAVGAPLNVVTGNSSGYNFSSGRLDHVPYHRQLWIRRQRLRGRVLDRVFRAWVDEAALETAADGKPVVPQLPPIETWAWEWQWDGFDSIDPEAEATTDGIELAQNTTTLAEVCARKGTDWKAVLTQRAAEKKFAEGLGLTPAEADQAATQARPAPARPDPNAAQTARTNRAARQEAARA